MFKGLQLETEALCHECGKCGHAVRFRLRLQKQMSESILCWSCFVPAMQVLMELGVLYRHPRDPEVFVIQQQFRAPEGRDGQRSQAGTEWDSRTRGHSESVGRSESTTEGRNRNQTISISEGEAWSQTDGHGEPM